MITLRHGSHHMNGEHVPVLEVWIESDIAGDGSQLMIATLVLGDDERVQYQRPDGEYVRLNDRTMENDLGNLVSDVSNLEKKP